MAPSHSNTSPTYATIVDLDELITEYGQATSFWENQPDSGVLTRVRLADVCRDAGVRPVSGEMFESGWITLDLDHHQRFSLFVSGLELHDVARRIPVHCSDRSGDAVFSLLVSLTNRLPHLTLDVLQQSDVRVEEFARHFCSEWGLKIKGERDVQSKKRLHDVDFGRLMKEAEAARSSAAERMAYLRELQENEEATRRPRRGKW